MRRRIWTLALVALPVVATGCQVRLDTAIEVREGEDDARLDLAFGIKLLPGFPSEAASGDATDDQMSPEEVRADIADSAAEHGFDANAVTVEEHTDPDGFEGVRVVIDPISFTAINGLLSDEEDSFFESFTLARDADRVTLNATLAALADEFGEGMSDGLDGQKRGDDVAQAATEDPFDDFGSELEDAFGDLDPSQLFDVSVRVTFPGAVLEHNATRLEGTTAVWDIDPSQPATLIAVAAASGSGGGVPPLLWVLIAAVVVALVVLVVLLLARRGRSGGSAPPPGYSGGYGPAPGPAGPPGAAAPGWGQPPWGPPGGSPPTAGPYGAPPPPHGPEERPAPPGGGGGLPPPPVT